MKEQEGLTPDVQTYSSAISACEAAGEWQRAIGVLSSMSDGAAGAAEATNGAANATSSLATPLNLYCFNAAIAACEKGGAWLEALELYERIRDGRGGTNLRPNFVTVNSLLIALDGAGQREMAESVYREAVSDGVVDPWRMKADDRDGGEGRVVRVMVSS